MCSNKLNLEMEEELARDNILKYLNLLYNKLSVLCESNRKEAQAVESDYDKVDKILENWKNQSLIILNEAMTNVFNDKTFALKEKVVEWNKTYKNDSEIIKAIKRLSTLLSEWREYVKAHIMKNPLLTVDEYSKYEDIKKALKP